MLYKLGKAQSGLKREIVVIFFIQIICWLKGFHRWNWRHIFRTGSGSFHILDTPSLNGIKVPYLTLGICPFSTSKVDAYLDLLPYLVIVQQITFILNKLHKNMLWVLFFGGYYQFSFSETIVPVGLGLIYHFNSSLNFHVNYFSKRPKNTKTLSTKMELFQRTINSVFSFSAIFKVNYTKR